MPKIEVEYNMKERVNGFFEFLKERAMDKAHELNRDLLADFVDKFLVVEMKRLETVDDIRTTQVDVSREVLLEPLRQVRHSVDEYLKGFIEGTAGTSDPLVINGPARSLPVTATPLHTQPDLALATPKTRSGNGHAKAKIRDLLGGEKSIIRADFMALNGQINYEDKDCTAIKAKLGPEVTPFQVTGFVTALHLEIASGKAEVPDMPAYLAFIQTHRDLWSRYNSPKYVAMRELNPAFKPVV